MLCAAPKGTLVKGLPGERDSPVRPRRTRKTSLGEKKVYRECAETQSGRALRVTALGTSVWPGAGVWGLGGDRHRRACLGCGGNLSLG